jgi:hypothetical protein
MAKNQLDKKNREIIFDVYHKIIKAKSKVGRETKPLERRLDEIKRLNK